jgi:hypothetical protein
MKPKLVVLKLSQATYAKLAAIAALESVTVEAMLESNASTLAEKITAIGNVTAGTQGKFNPTLPYTVYDLSGRVVAGDAQHGVFIVKQGNNTFKVMR